MTMNRQKALLVLCGLEFMLVALCTVLYTSDVMGTKGFVAALFGITLMSSALIFLIIRKLPPV